MEYAIPLVVAGFVFTRIVAIALFGFLLYQVLRPTPAKVPARSQGDYARERAEATRRS